GLGALLSFTLSADEMSGWGWRLLFLLSVPMGLVALYIRSRLDESPEFLAMVKASAERAKPSFAEVVSSQWKQMLKLGSFVMLTALSFYIFATYMTTFLSEV